MDYLNYKIQAHVRVYEENKLEEKNDTYWNSFVVKVQVWRIIIL